MIKQINMVKEFHSVMKGFKTEGYPTLNVPNYVVSLREKLIKEETKEVFEAIEKKDLPNLLKEYCDLLYVVYGGIIEHGLENLIEESFQMVQDSNMSKLDNNGNPIFREDGKLLKGPNYKAPDMGVFFKHKAC